MQELPPEAAFRAAPFLPRYCGKFLQRKYFVAGPPVCGDFFAILQEMRRPGKGGATKHTMNTKTYPRTNDRRTIYLNTVIDNPYIEVGDYTIYNDFVNDPAEFEKNNVLYHYPINKDRLVIGKFCSIACGARFLFNSANHTLGSLANYTFPLFFEEWELDRANVAAAWDNKGDIIIGNDVWIGYEAVIMAGVRIGAGRRHTGRSALHDRGRRPGQNDTAAFRRQSGRTAAGAAMVELAGRKDPRKPAPHHAGRNRQAGVIWQARRHCG